MVQSASFRLTQINYLFGDSYHVPFPRLDCTKTMLRYDRLPLLEIIPAPFGQIYNTQLGHCLILEAMQLLVDDRIPRVALIE